jgi:N-glycosylase/DNA lyase
MKTYLGNSTPFDLDATLCCGQTFRWERQGEWWYGVVRDKAFKIRQIGNKLEFENVDANFVKFYFGLDDDLSRICAQICKDKHIKRAVEMFEGLRILHQDPWECLISYICATYKNIAAIRQMLQKLSCKFGERIYFDGQDFYAFPIPEELAKASVAEFLECGLGYRAKYLHATVQAVNAGDFILELLRKEPYEKAKLELQRLSGVGLKAADCILLFSLEKHEAFPVDVWIRRVLLKYYSTHFQKEFITKVLNRKSLTRTEYERLNRFGREYFGEHAGYAQEYLYNYERTKQ